jgi:hypothetical protein
MFSASPVLTLDRYRLFLPLPLTSVNSVRSALKSTLNSTTPLASAGHPPEATIPFRITSFAHPHHLTPIESYSCKKQGRGWYPAPPPSPFLVFPQRVTSNSQQRPFTSSGDEGHLHSFHAFIQHFPSHTGWGLIVDQTLNEAYPCRAIIERTGYLRYADHRPRSTNHIFSARLRDLCVSALSFPSLFLSILNCRLPTFHFPQNSYPPAPKLRHNPAARGQYPQPNPHTGRIQ